MTRTIDEATLADAIVRNCAPTLAAIKPASLFTFPGAFVEAPGVDASEAAARRARFGLALASCRAQLAVSGIRARVLVWRGCGALVYVYRPKALASYLEDPRAAWPLAAEGYRVDDIDACLDRLAERLAARGKRTVSASAAGRDMPCPCDEHACGAAFPHELGYFLGYPYADVAGFIEHDGRDCLLMGPWKVYADIEGAIEAFTRIRRCTEALVTRYRRGDGLGELAVAFA